MRILLLFLTLCSFCNSQTTYKSFESEYIFRGSPISLAEMIERDIIISNEHVVIKTYGKEGVDIQTWRIINKEQNIDTHSENHTYYVELASGEETEYPAMFFLQFDKEGKAETITCEITAEVFERLPDEAPISVRFILD